MTAEERARLVDLLLESCHDVPLTEIEAAWDREIEQRAAAYDRGELKTSSAENVFTEARSPDVKRRIRRKIRQQ